MNRPRILICWNNSIRKSMISPYRLFSMLKKVKERWSHVLSSKSNSKCRSATTCTLISQCNWTGRSTWGVYDISNKIKSISNWSFPSSVEWLRLIKKTICSSCTAAILLKIKYLNDCFNSGQMITCLLFSLLKLLIYIMKTNFKSYFSYKFIILSRM